MLRSLRLDSAVDGEYFIGMFDSSGLIIGRIGIKQTSDRDKTWIISWCEGRGMLPNFRKFLEFAKANMVENLIMYARTQGMAVWAIRSGWIMSRERCDLRWGIYFSYRLTDGRF